MSRKQQEPRDLNDRLIEFAHSLLDAVQDDDNLDRKLEIFKACISFTASANKRTGKPSKDAEVADFDGFRRKVAEAGRGD